MSCRHKPIMIENNWNAARATDPVGRGILRRFQRDDCLQARFVAANVAEPVEGTSISIEENRSVGKYSDRIRVLDPITEPSQHLTDRCTGHGFSAAPRDRSIRRCLHAIALIEKSDHWFRLYSAVDVKNN